ncbi:MAG: hypothetical protein LBC87_10080 [Fibromonadaceae bacterium]|jgi:hypothetical protein|nr:hypothetical protein [Fibromonadaceae bacterium]
MFKKIIGASIALAFIACSNENNSPSTPSGSSPSQGGSSSSAEVLETVLISNLGTSGGLSALFNTYPYGYTLRANKDEDLTKYWSCPTAAQDTKPDIVACDKREEGKENDAILQNWLTTQSSPLHYIINNMATASPVQRAIKLDRYNLTGEGDQAALGLNVSSDEISNIEEMGIDALNGIKAFSYYYAGGAHKFRVAVSDADFWYADVPAQEAEGEVRIYVKDLKGMGSFAANEDEGKEETPFDIGKATKFLWVVEYDANPANNTGSLLVYLFNALIKR